MGLLAICRKNVYLRYFGNGVLHKRLMSMLNTNLKRAPDLKRKLSVIIIPRRNFFWPFKRPTKEQLKITDNVPDNYNLIYQNTMDRYILSAQVITCVSATIVICTVIIKNYFSENQLQLSEWTNTQVDNEILVYATAFAFFVVVLQALVYILPTRIYYLPQQKNYQFIFHGNFPFSQRKLSCDVGDVYQLPETQLSPWKTARYMVKDRQKVILLDQYFRRPADLYVMLGIQRDYHVDKKE